MNHKDQWFLRINEIEWEWARVDDIYSSWMRVNDIYSRWIRANNFANAIFSRLNKKWQRMNNKLLSMTVKACYSLFSSAIHEQLLTRFSEAISFC
jgi:hypothetical protein